MTATRQKVMATLAADVIGVVSGLIANELSPGFHRILLNIGSHQSAQSGPSPDATARAARPSPTPSPTPAEPAGEVWPSVIGKTMKDAYWFLNPKDFHIQTAHGAPEGVLVDDWVITDQNPKPGESVGDNRILEVWIQAP